MNVQVKSSLIIIATLLIGMLLGGLVTGTLRGHRPRWPAGQPGEGRLEMMLQRVIQPDETQQPLLEKIIDGYSSRFLAQHEQHFDEMKSLMDSLLDDLTPVLSDEQLTRLKEMSDRRGRGFPGPGKRGHKPKLGDR